MKVPALIMAGGKGSRMGLPVEKPLACFHGEPLVGRVVNAVKSAKLVSEFFVITSQNAPQTEKWCVEQGLPVFRAEGKGYHLDLKQVITQKNLHRPVLTVSSDLPTLTGEFLDSVVEAFVKCGKDALAVYVPFENRKAFGLSTSSLDVWEGKQVVISGVNMINGAKIDEPTIPSGAWITDDAAVLYNVNTKEDLEIAEKEKING
jgi:adenosylcobinamide-phosphate guanylyltransferase